MPPRDAVVFFGTPAFAVPFLDVLHDKGVVRAVVTQPDRPAGRGKSLAAPPVKTRALELGLPVHQPERIRDPAFRDALVACAPTLGFVVAYGKILPSELLALPTLGCVNAHASLLPRWRGASPIAHAILAGDAATGVCLMQMDEGMDTGPVLATARTPIGDTETCGELTHRLSLEGASLLKEKLPSLLEGSLESSPQPTQGVTLANKLAKSDGLLSSSDTAAELARRVRAMSPWPGAFVDTPLGRLKVHQATAIESAAPPEGDALFVMHDDILGLRCRSGWLRFDLVQMAGSKPMEAKAFLAGKGRAMAARGDT